MRARIRLSLRVIIYCIHSRYFAIFIRINILVGRERILDNHRVIDTHRRASIALRCRIARGNLAAAREFRVYRLRFRPTNLPITRSVRKTSVARRAEPVRPPPLSFSHSFSYSLAYTQASPPRVFASATASPRADPPRRERRRVQRHVNCIVVKQISFKAAQRRRAGSKGSAGYACGPAV